jgi:hypothetical protein
MVLFYYLLQNLLPSRYAQTLFSSSIEQRSHNTLQVIYILQKVYYERNAIPLALINAPENFMLL